MTISLPSYAADSQPLHLSWSADRRDPSIGNYATLGSYWQVRSTSELMLRRANEFGTPEPADLCIASYNGAMMNYRMGRFDQGDMYLQNCFDIFKASSAWQTPINLREGMDVDFLCSIGKVDQAKRLLEIAVANRRSWNSLEPDVFGKVALLELPNNPAAAVEIATKYSESVIGKNWGPRYWQLYVYQRAHDKNKAASISDKFTSQQIGLPAILDYSQVIDCWNAINRRDNESAKLLLPKLFVKLKERYNASPPFYSSIDLQVVLFNFAVMLTDQGSFDLASWVLSELESNLQSASGSSLSNPNSAKMELAAESLYIAGQKQSKNFDAGISKLRGFAQSDCPSGELLRQLGVLAYYSGDLGRADFFYALANKTDMTAAKGYENRKALLLLDIACSKAMEEDFEQADVYFKQAMALPVVPDAGSEFWFRRTSVELAFALSKYGKRAQAEHVLELTLARKPAPKVATNDHNYGECETALALASLLQQDGQTERALNVIKKNLVSDAFLTTAEHMFIAKCAESTHDLTFAAAHKGVQKHSAYSQLTDKDYEDQIPRFRAALALAEKAQPPDNNLIAKICYDLAESLRGLPNPKQTPEERLALLQRAARLSEKGTPEYFKYSYAADSEVPAQDSHFYDLNLEELSAAKTAVEKYRCYVALSSSAIEKLKDYSESIKWAKLAIDTYQKDFYASGPLSPGYIGQLTQSKHSSEAESLLKSALAKMSEVHGADSLEASRQCYLLFCYYAENNQENVALRYLDLALRTDMNTGYNIMMTCSRPPDVPTSGVTLSSFITGYTLKHFWKTNKPFALQILRKLLAAEERCNVPRYEQEHTERLITRLDHGEDHGLDLRTL
ncbi:MAG TPA: hypothetical protein V6C76_14950 [Drouetiella sp.]